VGLSLGGGGTDKGSCRDRRCITEHNLGTIADNTIAHCNDFGIYINSASQSTVRNNTLTNTYGIDVRFATASAFIQGNTLDGTIRARDGASMDASHNHAR
jgi:parallel beta-helix repeat protein